MITIEEHNETRDELMKLEHVAIYAAHVLRMYKEGLNLQDYPDIMKGLEDKIVVTKLFEWLSKTDERVKSRIKARKEKEASDGK